MMIASLMFYKKTGEQKYLVKFEEARHYCINHFCDDRFGEWYGYLHGEQDAWPYEREDNASLR